MSRLVTIATTLAGIVAIATGIWLTATSDDYAVPRNIARSHPVSLTVLPSPEVDSAVTIALGDESLAGKLDGHRYRVISAEQCSQKVGDCIVVSVFDYDTGYCWAASVNMPSGVLGGIAEGGCSMTAEETAEAFAIASGDSLVREHLNSYEDAMPIERGKLWFPGGGDPRHRYVELRWSTSGGTSSTDFVIDLTTRSVCHEC